jgi:hypothetical protein
MRSGRSGSRSTSGIVSRVAKPSGRPLLNHRQQQHHPRGDDRERITSARQAAEALFTPKRQPVEPSVSDPVPSAEQPARKPRVLPILSRGPVRNEEVAAPSNPEPCRSRGTHGSCLARANTAIGGAGAWLVRRQVAEAVGSSSHLTHRWREMDSNHRFPARIKHKDGARRRGSAYPGERADLFAWRPGVHWRDRLTAGGSWIRTLDPPSELT